MRWWRVGVSIQFGRWPVIVGGRGRRRDGETNLAL
jgi:hypothetical protein